MDKKLAEEFLRYIEQLRDFYIDRATGGDGSSYNYQELRKIILLEASCYNSVKSKLPKLLDKQNANAFWQFIKHKYSTYEERRVFIYNEFEEIVKHLEDIIYSKKATINKVELPFNEKNDITKEFIITQIEEAQKRIDSENYEAAITSSKSLIEAVFAYVDKEINKEKTINSKDDLIKQYSSIKKMLNLDPSQKDLSDSLKQILQGLNSIICGLSFFRNKMSDAHLPQYKPQKHHAILAVNSANTLAQFLFDTHIYQKNKNSLAQSSK